MGGLGIPKLYVKFLWPLFLAMKFTFLFLNLAGGVGGSTGLGNILRKKNNYFLLSASLRTPL